MFVKSGVLVLSDFNLNWRSELDTLIRAHGRLEVHSHLVSVTSELMFWRYLLGI